MRFLRDNSLTIALLTLFVFSFIGMLLTGWRAENQELAQHGQAAITLFNYSRSGDFVSAVFENWESEFLQMATYVVLTAYLFQRGSAESKDPDQSSPQDESPTSHVRDPAAPWPVRSGQVVRSFYSYSLGIVLVALFIVSFVLHWLGSVHAANQDALLHGGEAQGASAYLGDPQLWFESFQNWQSEFLSTAVLVVLSIMLRFRGSPESKPVAAPTLQTSG
jgi:hypothetical protein